MRSSKMEVAITKRSKNEKRRKKWLNNNNNSNKFSICIRGLLSKVQTIDSARQQKENPIIRHRKENQQL